MTGVTAFFRPHFTIQYGSAPGQIDTNELERQLSHYTIQYGLAPGQIDTNELERQLSHYTISMGQPLDR